MMKTLLLTCLFVVSAGFAAGAGNEYLALIQTLQGRTFHDCSIKQVHPDGVSFIHANGAAKVLYSDLNDSLKKQLGFNEERFARYKADRANRELVERERRIQANLEASEQEKQHLEMKGRIMERAAQVQAQRHLQAQQHLAAAYANQFDPADDAGGPSAFYGPLNAIQGPALGGRDWTRRGRTLQVVFVGDFDDCGFGHQGWMPWSYGPIWTNPCGFGSFGGVGSFGGGFFGGPLILGIHHGY